MKKDIYQFINQRIIDQHLSIILK